ncbi:RNA-binding protein 12B-like [Gastrophryne carolinensis]
MSLTVRLQGLPLLADASHIQEFFSGLKIQYGGVRFIGGGCGDALVKFTSFMDACYALQRSGNLLMNSCVKVSLEDQFQQTPSKSHRRSVEKPGYLRVTLQPLSATFSDVSMFFQGLTVKSVIFLTKGKVRNGQALVKFDKRSHACKALKAKLSDKSERGFSVLCIKQSSEEEWIKFGGKINPSRDSRAKGTSVPKTVKQPFPMAIQCEFYAQLTNVSSRAEGRHIKRFLLDLVDESRITFVYDKHGCRTRDCFVRFSTHEDYTKALSLDKTILKGRPVRVLPVSKEHMKQFIDHTPRRKSKDTSKDMESEAESSCSSFSLAKASWLYLRNFSADVNKQDILNFFAGFSLKDKDIYLLQDDNGSGLGEALVKFSTEEGAANAEKLNRKDFGGTEILVRSISQEQLKVFGVHDSKFNFDDIHDSSMDKQESWACVSMEDDTPDILSDSP